MPDKAATILVVDDERVIRELCSLILRELGYPTLSADDGGSALHIYRTTTPKIDLVILDMDMPILNGAATFHALRAYDPAARVLISTGYVGEEVDALRTAGAAGIVQKPFRVVELSNAVVAALG